MSKHDNDHDDVPITFAEPVGRTRIPRPVNQPNWLYNNNPQATRASKVIYNFYMSIFVVAITVALFIGVDTRSSVALIFAGALALLAYVYYRSMRVPGQSKSDNEEETLNPKRLSTRKKKYPKHRKDYR